MLPLSCRRCSVQMTQTTGGQADWNLIFEVGCSAHAKVSACIALHIPVRGALADQVTAEAETALNRQVWDITIADGIPHVAPSRERVVHLTIGPGGLVAA